MAKVIFGKESGYFWMMNKPKGEPTISLEIEQQVALTFVRNGILRNECAWILRCSTHCIDTQLETARKNCQYECSKEFICDCVEKKWVRKFSPEEKIRYKELALHNQKNHITRKPGEDILWEKYYKELYGD